MDLQCALQKEYEIPSGYDQAVWNRHDVSADIEALKPICIYNDMQISCSKFGNFYYDYKRALRVTYPTPRDVSLILKNKYKLIDEAFN